MNRIKELRQEKELTQQALADRLAISRQAVSNYEGEIRQLDPKTIEALCGIFSVTSDYLLGLSTQRTAQISDEDAALVSAYHAAPASVRQGIDALLQPYREDTKTTEAAG